MYCTHHTRIRTRRITVDGVTVRTARPSRTNDRRKAVAEQMGGAR